MPSTESHAIFQRALEAQHARIKKQLKHLYDHLAAQNGKGVESTASLLAMEIDRIQGMVAAQDFPQWLTDLKRNVDGYSGSKNGHLLLDAIVSNYARANSHSWNTQPIQVAAIDFDKVYKEQYEQSRIPELLDELLKYVQQIIDSGQVDSISTLRTLEMLAATIRKNVANKSYAASFCTADFAKRVVRHMLFAALKDVPVVKYAVEGIEKALEDIEKEKKCFLEKSEAAIDVKFVEALPTPVKMLAGPTENVITQLAGETFASIEDNSAPNEGGVGAPKIKKPQLAPRVE